MSAIGDNEVIKYSCMEELEGKTLSCGDYIAFDFGEFKLIYRVSDDYLTFLSIEGIIKEKTDFHNAAVFEIIKERGNDINKFDFAAEAYGYPADLHDYEEYFPSCITDDYEALTRITMKLFEVVGKYGYNNWKRRIEEMKQE